MLTAQQRLDNVRERLLPKLPEALAAQGCRLGDAAFVRIFKESRELELWLQRGGASGTWVRFRTYPIAVFSGTLGPKQREGDLQAPEGFYAVTASALNPASRYHLAFNVGYPNAYDRHHQRTVIQVAELRVGADGWLSVDRDAPPPDLRELFAAGRAPR